MSATARMASPDESVTRRMCPHCSRSRTPAKNVPQTVYSSSTKRALRLVPESCRWTILIPPAASLPAGVAASVPSVCGDGRNSTNDTSVPTGPQKKSVSSRPFCHQLRGFSGGLAGVRPRDRSLPFKLLLLSRCSRDDADVECERRTRGVTSMSDRSDPDGARRKDGLRRSVSMSSTAPRELRADMAAPINRSSRCRPPCGAKYS